MQADFSVELGPDDDVLDFPWKDPAGRWCYYNLKDRPELLLETEEPRQFPELGEFLVTANLSAGKFESAKCDVWFTTEMNVEDEIFGAEIKFGSYVDILFSDHALRLAFEAHKKLAQSLAALLKRVPEIPAAAEFIVRRCFYSGGKTSGFYITFYLFGYGDDEAQARQRWGIGLKLAENALLQLSARG
jgi:hypothetical protein